MKLPLVPFLLVAFPVPTGTALVAAEAAATPPLPATKIAPAPPLRAQEFDLADVRLGEGPFRAAMRRDRDYLLRLDPDRLLHNFRVNVGLPSQAQPYGGWEAPRVELRGHAVGHYLSACALMFRSTGDAELKRRIDHLIAELAKCQAASPEAGFGAGYLSAFPESLIVRVEKGQPVWAPWYTLHKILAGLLDSYRLAGNTQAFDVLVKEAAWIQARLDRLTPEQIQVMLKTEFGGMNEVLANLYALTGDPAHLRLARLFDHAAVFDPLARGEDKLDGLHANTQIPKVIGAAREYELTGEPRYRTIAENFWRDVALRRSYVIGGDSDHEHFFPPTDFARHLSAETAETCNTYNMLKLTRQLFSWAPDAAEMDFYERGLFNHILASQDPDEGMFVYLMALKPGHFKTYSTPENSFWCCVGTGMENHAKYADTIFHHDGQETLFVNLFIAAELDWKGKGVRVVQETNFPAEDGARLTIHTDKPVEFALRIRHPGWATEGMAVAVNGARLADSAATRPGSYGEIRRVWRDGDRVDVKVPLTLHPEPLPNAPNLIALLYGPIVLAADLGAPEVADYVRDQLDDARVPGPIAPVLVRGTEGTGDVWLQNAITREPGEPLAFRLRSAAQPDPLTLLPFYQLHHRRFTVYWPVLSPAENAARLREIAAAEEQIRRTEQRALDRVVAGDPASEGAHGFAPAKADGKPADTGSLAGHPWRHALRGGSFSYALRSGSAAGAQPLAVACTFAGNDAGTSFDVLLDGTKIATAKLDGGHASQFIEQTFPIPPELTRGKDTITVKFQAPRGGATASVFACALVPAP